MQASSWSKISTLISLSSHDVAMLLVFYRKVYWLENLFTTSTTYPEMQVFAHTRSTVMPRLAMPCLETICMNSFAHVSLHQILLFDHFLGLIPFTILIFPTLFNTHSCMAVTNCSSIFAGALSWRLFSLALPMQLTVCFMVPHDFYFL